MYEGKNIHYSPVDNKPLCSFSSKLCKQHRLNHYGFCVRHILEDLSAPFKQCAYVNKYNKQKCTQAIPESEERDYCNAHMQVLGMMPRRERKNQRHVTPDSLHDSKPALEGRLKSKPKFSLMSTEPVNNDNSMDDPDDPYAFPADDDEPPQPPKPSYSPGAASVGPQQDLPMPGNGGGHLSFRPPQEPVSSIAKLYPELAEKLERVKNKSDHKTKLSGTKSSRTMNQLQTRIAQNRIKAKKGQEQSNHSTPESQGRSPNPAVPRSPAGGGGGGEKPQFAVRNPHLSFAALQGHLGMTHPLSQQMPPLQNSATSYHPNATLSQLLPRMPHPLMPPQASPVGGVNMNLPPPPYPHPHSQPSPHSGGLSQPMNYPPPPYSNHSKSHILTTRLKRPRNILSEEEARKRLRTDTAMAVLAQHIQKRLFDSELLQYDVDTSEDEEDLLPRQNHWLGLSSDEEAEESVSSEDEDLGTMRLIKLSQHTSDIRRQYGQLCKAQHSNSALQDYRRTFAQALLQAARESPAAAVKAVLEVDGRTERRRRKRKKRVKSEVDKGLQKRSCLYKNEDRNEQCNNTALPYTNHCIKHIMYNVDQQLFDYCTAKTADNTQCCFPTFDIRHDMPLCMQHGKSADNYVPEPVPETELLKRPRKKTKPSALTRKTKKKKKVPNVRPEEVTALQEESDDGHEPGSPEHHPALDHSRDQLPPQRSGGGTKLPSGGGAPAPLAAAANDISDDLQGGLEADLEEVLSPGAIDKSFDLPLDQASKLLDDNDIHEVLIKLPDDLDLFSGKNGEFEPTTEELERALAAASGYSKDSLENMEKDLPEMTEEELTDRITDTILETENLNASFGDLSNENLNQLASLAHSISANEFKAMAQTASSTPVFTNNSMVSESQTYSHRPHGQVHAQGQGQMYPGQGHFSQIQSALSNGIYMGGQGLPQQQQPPPQQQQQHPGYIQRQYSHPSQQIYQPEGQVMVPHRTSPGHFGNGHANVSPHAVNGAVLAGDHIPPSPHQHSPLNPRSPMHAQSPLPGHMPVHAQSPMQSPLPSARPWFPQGQERPLTPGTPVSYHNGYPMGTPPYSQSVGPSPPSLKYTYASNQFQNSEFIHQEGRFPQHLNMTVNPQLIQRGFEANQGGFHPQWPGQHGQYHPRAGHGMMHTQGGS